MQTNTSNSVTTISDATRQQIQAVLTKIEADHRLRVLFACESGSRAWGFASSDSDFDVRFIFVRPVEDYLRLRSPVDAFDEQAEGDIDAAGWDIRKTAELMRRSNPPLMEWIDSPVVYRAIPGFIDELRTLRSLYFDAKKAAFHYLNMAYNVWKGHILDIPSPVRKRYLYCLRPLACVRFIDMHHTQPPTEFGQVLNAIDWPSEAMMSVRKMVHDKQAGQEMGAGVPDHVLNQYIPLWLAQGQTIAEKLPVNEHRTDELDRFIFKHALSES